MSYLLIWFIYFIRSSQELFIKTSNKKNVVFCLFLIITLFTGIRYYMGTDYHNYYSLFNTLSDPKSNQNYEIGFLYIVAILKKMGLDPYGIFFFISMFSFYLVKKGVNYNSKSTAMSLLIYYSVFMIPFNFNAVGQGIVIAIFLYSIEMMERRETKKILTISLIAILIHSSGIMIIVSYIVYRMKITTRQMLFMSIFSIGLILINSFLLKILVRFSPDFFSKILLNYMTTFSESIGFVSLMQRITILGLIFIFSYDKLDEHNRRMMQIYVFGFFLYTFFSFNSLFATRINLGFRVIEVILLPNILFSMRKKANKIVLFLTISLLVFLVLVSNFSNPNIYPYKHWWSY